MSEPLPKEPSASRLTPSLSTPNLARKVSPPSATGKDASYKLGVPGWYISPVPQHGQGIP